MHFAANASLDDSKDKGAPSRQKLVIPGKPADPLRCKPPPSVWLSGARSLGLQSPRTRRPPELGQATGGRDCPDAKRPRREARRAALPSQKENEQGGPASGSKAAAPATLGPGPRPQVLFLDRPLFFGVISLCGP